MENVESRRKSQQKYYLSEKGRKTREDWYKNNKEKHRENGRKYYRRHKEKLKIFYTNNSKKYRNKIKIELFNLLGGCFCTECGANAFEALEINHIVGGGGKERFKNNSSFFRTYTGRYQYFKKNPDKIKEFNVLCRICNAHHYLRDLKKIKGGKWEVIFTPDPQ